MSTHGILKVALVAVLLVGGGAAWADGGRGHGGGYRGGGYHGGGYHGGGWRGSVYLGLPLFAPYYSSWPYYGYGGYGGYYGPGPWYPPAVVGVPTTPPVYIEQAPQAAAPAQQYWYWCADPQGYYPTVRDCRQPWTPVLPQPNVQQ